MHAQSGQYHTIVESRVRLRTKLRLMLMGCLFLFLWLMDLNSWIHGFRAITSTHDGVLAQPATCLRLGNFFIYLIYKLIEILMKISLHSQSLNTKVIIINL